MMAQRTLPNSNAMRSGFREKGKDLLLWPLFGGGYIPLGEF